MISLNSAKTFVKLNLVLWAIGHAFMGIYNLTLTTSFGFMYLIFLVLMYAYLLAKNHFILNLLEYSVREVQPIDEAEPPKEKYDHEFDYFIAKDTITDVLALMIVKTSSVYYMDSIFWDLLLFIPKTFLLEVVFDFFHYWAHRICHHRKLYWIHKTHHAHQHPKGITVFYQDPLDLIINNVIPFFLASHIISLSVYQMALFVPYKTFIEVSGHLGRRLYPISSFSQFIWLPRLLGIEIYSEDHDAHHTKIKYNFSKRFTLWDRVFGTFKRLDKTTEKIEKSNKIQIENTKYSEYSPTKIWVSLFVMIFIYLISFYF